jgi:hypothetical protein
MARNLLAMVREKFEDAPSGANDSKVLDRLERELHDLESRRPSEWR